MSAPPQTQPCQTQPAGFPARVRALVEWERGAHERHVLRAGELAFLRRERQAAPVSYGCLPGVLNPADGAEVDAVFPGDAALGTLGVFVVFGMLWLPDGDHKLLLGEGKMAQDAAAAALAWFPPERGAELRSAAEALAWLGTLEGS